jgi:FkbM family methyltransferase
MLQDLLAKCGIYYAKRRYMPRGIDWLWDLKRVLPSSIRTVIDVGANEGQTVRAVTAAFPTAQVHAFEPIRSTFDTLCRGFEGDARVHLHNLAVSSANGVVQMRSEAGSQLSHVDPALEAGGDRIEAVDAVTLDSFCERHNISNIDILKTDTEGHDLEVLRGAGGLLSAQRIGWVLVEVTFNVADQTHTQFGPVLSFLEQSRMRPWGFYDVFHVDETGHLAFLNVLFGRPLD